MGCLDGNRRFTAIYYLLVHHHRAANIFCIDISADFIHDLSKAKFFFFTFSNFRPGAGGSMFHSKHSPIWDFKFSSDLVWWKTSVMGVHTTPSVKP